MTLLVLKITLLFALGLALPPVLRKASASTRHLVIVTALVASLLLPGLLPVMPAWEVLPVQKAAPAATPKEAISGILPASEPRTEKPAIPANARGSARVAAEPSGLKVLWSRALSLPRRFGWPALAATWAAGAVAMLLLLALRLASTHRIVGRSDPERDPERLSLLRELAESLSIRRAVALRRRGPGGMPMVWGFRRPVVLLPADSDEWSGERLRAVLAHELAHVARSDLAALFIGHVACAVHWFHPLAWVLKRRLATEREIACDDMALGQGIEPRRYATHLLDIAAACGSTRSLAPVMAARSQLEGRIMAILDDNPNRGNASLTARTTIAALTLALAIPLASLTWARAATKTVVIAPGAVASVPDRKSDVAQFNEELQRLNYVVADVSRLIAGLDANRPETRAACAWALGENGDPRAVEPLIETLDDRSDKTREWVARSLGRLGDPRAIDPLIERLDDDSPAVREWVARSLAELGDPRAGLHLIGNLDDPDPDARQWAVRALADLGDEKAVEPLLARIHDPDAEVRQWIVRALADLGDKRAIPGVRQLLDDPDAEVQEYAVRALGDLGVERRDWHWDPKREEPLMPSLDDTPPKPGDPESIASLIRSLGSEDADVRQWSARSLGDIGDASAVTPLIALIADENAEVREWAIRVLGMLGDARAVTPLLDALDDAKPEVREWSVRTLGTFQDALMFNPLVDRLADPSADVREWAARALGAYGDPSAIEPLTSLLDDEDSDVRRWAERAVEAIRSQG